MAGTIIENVPPLHGRDMGDLHPDELDLSDSSITENTRFSYPLSCNPNVAEGARGPAPETIVLLTADAFGVLPPVSILESREVMYHFVMGFTSKLAGTEVGITEPKAAFSACFGAPFMAHFPSVYARRLAEKMESNETRCILLNTGWGGGPYGTGKRISIHDTRALLNAALAGELHTGDYDVHPIFNLKMPKACPGVDARILNPRNTWSDTEAYDQAAEKLLGMFRVHFAEQNFADLGIDNVTVHAGFIPPAGDDGPTAATRPCVRPFSATCWSQSGNPPCSAPVRSPGSAGYAASGPGSVPFPTDR